MRADRLLSLLLFLQTHGTVTAEQAAERLEVSVRTVYRDVEALSASGVPVWSQQGRGGGIRLMPGYRTDMTGLTASESRALVALTGKAIPEDLGMGSALASAVHKLVAAVPAAHREAAELARERVLVDHTGWYRTAPSAPLLETVQDAVWRDRRLDLDYEGSSGRTVGGVVDPYGLVIKAGVWYLVGRQEDEERMWRVDRIRRAAVLDEQARIPSGTDLAEVWSRMRTDIERPRGGVVVLARVREEAAAMFLRVSAGQRDGSPGEIGEAADGWIECRLTFRAVGAAAYAVLGFGGDVEVLEPAEVRDLVVQRATETLAVYSSPATDRRSQDPRPV